MPTYVNPPAALLSAIVSAAAKYGVPVDLLTGIWRVESASSYPNPYVNKEGYGGLFGTKDWNGTTQDQANTAAQILGQALVTAKGDVSQALSIYSGGGYTSVPGQTTTGTITGFAKIGQALATGTGSGNPLNPGQGSILASAEGLVNPGAIVAQVESWLGTEGKLVLAYVVLVGIAGAVFVTGLKGLGVKTPTIPAVVPA